MKQFKKLLKNPSNKYDYSRVKMVNCDNGKIVVTCPIHKRTDWHSHDANGNHWEHEDKLIARAHQEFGDKYDYSNLTHAHCRAVEVHVICTDTAE